MALPLVNLDTKLNTGGRGESLPLKVRDTLKAMAIPIQGPVWHLIMKASMATIAKALDTTPEMKQLLPLVKLREAKNWATIGFKTLS